MMSAFYFDTKLAFEIPEVLVKEIRDFMPRHEIAQLLIDANTADKLKLKYVGPRLNDKNPSYKWSIKERREFAPSVINSTLYGDDDAPMSIMRTNLTVGEKVRLRTITQQCHA